MSRRLPLLLAGLSAIALSGFAVWEADAQEEPPFSTVLSIERVELRQPLAVLVDDQPDQARLLAVIYLRLAYPTDFLPRAMLADTNFLGTAEGQIIGTMPGASVAAVAAPVAEPLDQSELWVVPGRSREAKETDKPARERLEDRRKEAPGSVVPLAPAIDAGLLIEESLRFESPKELFAHAAQRTATLEERQ